MNPIFGVKHGRFGYIRSRRKICLIRSVLLFGFAFGLFFLGLWRYGTNRNLFSVFAALSFLPAGVSLVNFIMFMRAGFCTEEMRDEIEAFDHHFACSYYDMFFTSETKNYSTFHLCVRDNTVICFVSESCDLGGLESHLKGLLAADGYKGLTLKAFERLDKYTERLESLSAKEPENEKLTHGIVDTLFSISLS